MWVGCFLQIYFYVFLDQECKSTDVLEMDLSNTFKEISGNINLRVKDTLPINPYLNQQFIEEHIEFVETEKGFFNSSFDLNGLTSMTHAQDMNIQEGKFTEKLFSLFLPKKILRLPDVRRFVGIIFFFAYPPTTPIFSP